MSDPIYFYLYCRSCGVKQYIGADLNLPCAVVDGDVPVAIKQAMHATMSSMEIMLKFLMLHGEHKVGVWTTASINEAPGHFPELWVYDADAGDIIVPAWDTIKPLGETDEDRRIRREINHWKMMYEQLYPAYMDLRILMEPDERNKMIAKKQLRQWAEEHDYGLYGDNVEADPTSITDVTPPPTDPLRARAQAIAVGLHVTEEIETDVE